MTRPELKQEFQSQLAKVQESRIILARARALGVTNGYTKETLALFDEADVKFADLEASYSDMVEKYS